MKKRFLFAGFLFFQVAYGYSQGCIAIRNISGFSQYLHYENALSTSDWLLNVNTRYFKSYKDFVGSTDLKTAPEDQFITQSYNIDLSVTHLLNHGWSLSLAVPVIANSREASKEHGGPGTTRHTTRSFGLGDIRFIAAKWLLTNQENMKGNIQLGLGLKLPTGDYEYKDYFYNNDTTRVLAPVNPAIQLGDGGLGLISEVYAYYIFNDMFSLYSDLYYLSNPREQNGVPIRQPLTKEQVKAGATETSVTDAYALRLGANINLVKQLSIAAGIRYEGIPVHDFIGASGGSRRPGHIFSIEPGILYRINKVLIYGSVPFAISRSIDQNVPDKIVYDQTGVNKISPGGLGDYQVFLGALINL